MRGGERNDEEVAGETREDCTLDAGERDGGVEGVRERLLDPERDHAGVLPAGTGGKKVARAPCTVEAVAGPAREVGF